MRLILVKISVLVSKVADLLQQVVVLLLEEHSIVLPVSFLHLQLVSCYSLLVELAFQVFFSLGALEAVAVPG